MKHVLISFTIGLKLFLALRDLLDMLWTSIRFFNVAQIMLTISGSVSVCVGRGRGSAAKVLNKFI